MRFFKKLFGFGKSPETPPSVPAGTDGLDASTVSEGAPIKAFDKFGREIFISRQDWVGKVLLGQLEKEWDRPDALAPLILQAFSDGFFREIEPAARHLHRTDRDAARGTSLLGIVYLQTDRAAEAEQVLSKYLAEHGDNGVVLTNLAKAQAALGRDAQAEETLWQALKIDPNQDNGLGWYEVMQREKSGPAAGEQALRRIAAIPGSWRAQLWLARAALESRDLDEAIRLYQESLANAGKPVPTDLLIQMSGDLGCKGHIPEILRLVEPHFEVETHGIGVANNLIKASIDTGQLDSALSLLRQLEACQRPDWKEHLSFWESEVQKARLQTQDAIPRHQLGMTLLTLNGPFWLIPGHMTAGIVPPRQPDAPHIAFLGSSFEATVMPTEIKAQQSNGPGRMSRALPLFLNEMVCLHSDARTTTLIPWVPNHGGGFGLFGTAPDPQEMAGLARQATKNEEVSHPADFLVTTHLITRGVSWKLQLALVRTIDGKSLASFFYDLAEANFHRVSDQLKSDLLTALEEQAEIESKLPAVEEIPAAELDHYLFRLEQALAVRCAGMPGTEPTFLSNPAEILDGLLFLCLQNPKHVPSRILLWRVLDDLKAREPQLVKSMMPKVIELQSDHPLEAIFHQSLNAGFEAIRAGG